MYKIKYLKRYTGSFKPGTREGFILKLMDGNENYCFEMLKNDILAKYAPKVNCIVTDPTDNKEYIEMQDLLYDFDNPVIMDVKIGIRSFLEDECSAEPRKDLYTKILQVSPNDLSEEEHALQAITKKRYMTWREQSTCSRTLGFRITAIKVKKKRVQPLIF
jgi:1D-myo-inositol-triphosphate 3-kinase